MVRASSRYRTNWKIGRVYLLPTTSRRCSIIGGLEEGWLGPVWGGGGGGMWAGEFVVRVIHHDSETKRFLGVCIVLDALFIVLLCQYRLGDLGKVSMGRV